MKFYIRKTILFFYSEHIHRRHICGVPDEWNINASGRSAYHCTDSSYFLDWWMDSHILSKFPYSDAVWEICGWIRKRIGCPCVDGKKGKCITIQILLFFVLAEIMIFR